MSDPIISVKDLYHRYGDFTAVDGISFEVKEGEIFSFLGPNGAGKSTAINVLITLLPVQEGSATVAGYNVAEDPQNVRESIGIVFQDVTLDRDMTCREILEFHGNLYRMPKAERKKRIDELLSLVQLENKQDTRTKQLSGGMKRRLEIARGLMTRPRVLFLDEPTIGLDPQTRMRMWDYIKAVNREGTTIFLTTHYMDEADHLSDRISIIDKGQIIATGAPYELKNTLGEDLIYLETSDMARDENNPFGHGNGEGSQPEIKGAGSNAQWRWYKNPPGDHRNPVCRRDQGLCGQPEKTIHGRCICPLHREGTAGRGCRKNFHGCRAGGEEVTDASWFSDNILARYNPVLPVQDAPYLLPCPACVVDGVFRDSHVLQLQPVHL